MISALFLCMALAATPASCVPLSHPDIEWSTFLGGDHADRIYATTRDGEGNIFLVGWTESTDFPTTPGAFDPTHNGKYDVFVVKMTPAGESLIWSTFLGGKRWEKGLGITLDPDGNPIVIGWTQSNDFPVTAGTFDTRMDANSKLFVVKLHAEGSHLLWSTLLGGHGDETVFRVEQDREGHLVLAGWTQSPDFPTTPGAYDTTHGGGRDVFAAKLHRSGGCLIWSTYLGGRIYDYAHDFVLDPDENLVLVGSTGTRVFPTTGNAYQKDYNGGTHDAFVVKLSASGDSLLWSTFLGGSALDEAWGVAINPDGHLVVAGRSQSEDFPTTEGVLDRSYGGGGDAFVVELDGEGTALHWGTYLGGESEDRAWTLHLDSKGRPIISGTTFSPDFPVCGPAEGLPYGGEGDAFLSKLDRQGRRLLWSTTLGGSQLEESFAFFPEGEADVLLVGETNSPEFPTTQDVLDTSYHRGPDSFITQFRIEP
jgi:hypothetical protein